MHGCAYSFRVGIDCCRSCTPCHCASTCSGPTGRGGNSALKQASLAWLPAPAYHAWLSATGIYPMNIPKVEVVDLTASTSRQQHTMRCLQAQRKAKGYISWHVRTACVKQVRELRSSHEQRRAVRLSCMRGARGCHCSCACMHTWHLQNRGGWLGAVQKLISPIAAWQTAISTKSFCM